MNNTKSYFTVLMNHYNEKGELLWIGLSWTKKIYDNKESALDAITQMRATTKFKGIDFKIVELRIVNELNV